MKSPLTLVILALTLTAAAFFSTSPAAAQGSTTFAQYNVDATGNVYSFINSGPTSTLFTNNDPGHPNLVQTIPVTFVYNINNGYGPNNTNIPARLSLTSQVSGLAQPYGIFVDQPLGQFNLTLTALTPVGGKTNLLTVTNSTGDITGISGGSTGSTSGDQQLNNNINFSSDFISFNGSSSRSFNIGFTSINPPLSINPTNQYLNNFTASGNGSFAAVVAPEPGSLFSLSVLGGCLAVCLLRRRALSA